MSFGFEWGDELNEIERIVANTIAITCIALLFLFAFTWIVFDFQGSSNSLRDTWGIVSSLFGGIATLVAAYIASLLFNDWRETQTAQNRAEHAKAVKKSLITLKSNMEFYRSQVLDYSNKTKPEERRMCKELKEDFLNKYHLLFMDLKINLEMYENTYNDNIMKNIDGPHLKAYFICILIAFEAVIDMGDEQPNIEVSKTLYDIEKFNSSFNEDFFLPILNKLNPHINLVS